jgi:hypothetical protein
MNSAGRKVRERVQREHVGYALEPLIPSPSSAGKKGDLVTAF